MRIPARFKLLGQTINVVYDPDIRDLNDETGVARYRRNKILLYGPALTVNRPQDQIEHTFCHELVHWLFYFAAEGFKPSKDFLHQEEGLVDRVAGLLHQALTTMEYDEDTE